MKDGPRFWVLALSLLVSAAALASPPPGDDILRDGLAGSPRARALLAAARSYLPSDWRFPETDRDPADTLDRLLTRLLPVTRREQRTAFSCGAASLGILLTSVGIRMGDRPLERLTRTTRYGIDPERLVEGCSMLGLEASWRFGAGVADLLRALEAGRPVIIDYQASYTNMDDPRLDWGHYSVVVAADATDVLLVDPSSVNAAHLRIIPRERLAGVWWDTFVRDGRRFDGFMLTVGRPVHPRVGLGLAATP